MKIELIEKSFYTIELYNNNYHLPASVADVFSQYPIECIRYLRAEHDVQSTDGLEFSESALKDFHKATAVLPNDTLLVLDLVVDGSVDLDFVSFDMSQPVHETLDSVMREYDYAFSGELLGEINNNVSTYIYTKADVLDKIPDLKDELTSTKTFHLTGKAVLSSSKTIVASSEKQAKEMYFNELSKGKFKDVLAHDFFESLSITVED